jgi:Tol biopolymer transport system component
MHPEAGPSGSRFFNEIEFLDITGFGVIHLRESMEAPPDTSFVSPYGGNAPSPHGRYVVFSATANKGGPSLWLRSLDSLAARSLPGTEGGNFPTWSPDSKSLAFYADGKLKRIQINGGAPLCVLPLTGTCNLQKHGQHLLNKLCKGFYLR